MDAQRKDNPQQNNMPVPAPALPPPVSENGKAQPRAGAKAAPAERFTYKSVLWGLLAAIFLALGTLLVAPKLRDWAYALLPESEHMQAMHLAGEENLRREVRKLEKSVAAVRGRFERMLPRDSYLIVNSSENKIYVKAGNKLIHEGLCSTGSNVLLKAADKREWMFATPRGMFKVIGKVKYPVWRMPDWAFIEEGRPVPPPDSPERFERGVLGDYALAFGNGYLIHGTLYKRMLGMPVTHGCVRLDDHELEIVYKNMQIGSRIFIY